MAQFNEDIWKQDNLPEAHFDDALWGFMIQISEQMQICVLGEYGDDVLFCLLHMGVGDWKEPDHRGNQAMTAMWHATAMVDCVLQRIKRGETSVKCFLMIPLVSSC